MSFHSHLIGGHGQASALRIVRISASAFSMFAGAYEALARATINMAVRIRPPHFLLEEQRLLDLWITESSSSYFHQQEPLVLHADIGYVCCFPGARVFGLLVNPNPAIGTLVRRAKDLIAIA